MDTWPSVMGMKVSVSVTSLRRYLKTWHPFCKKKQSQRILGELCVTKGDH
jgi:hypothetical protein